MRIFSRLKTHSITSPGTVILSGAKYLLLATCCTLLMSGLAAAQTLARPGWSGSGLASESWWRSAVFYRIDTAHFQDSDGDGQGDLPGISQRLDYLQSLGVDAIVIAPPADDNAFNDLLREAGGRRIRIIIAFDSTTSAATLLGQARLWLTRGAAGVELEHSFLAANPNASLHDLRTLTSSFPGDRVLLARPLPAPTLATQTTAQLVRMPIGNVAVDIASADLRRTFAGLEPNLPPNPPLLEINGRPAGASANSPDRSVGLQKILAARLLTARGATSLLYGSELGLLAVSADTEPTMRWTPTNITPPKPEPTPEEAARPAPPPPPPPENVYGAFKPYVPPKPVPKPKPTNGAAPAIDPNTLMGFSTKASGTTPAPAPLNPQVNVAVEDADPNSLLNFYRRLVQLHHGNSSIRSGTPYVFDHDAESALVWLRRAPAGSRTAANVVVTCNLSDKSLTLSLDDDFAHLHIRAGTLRPLLASWTTMPIAQYSNHIVLPPYSVFISELYH